MALILSVNLSRTHRRHLQTLGLVTDRIPLTYTIHKALKLHDREFMDQPQFFRFIDKAALPTAVLFKAKP